MTRLTIIGTVIAVFILTGCVDNRDIQPLKSAYLSLSNEVAHLRARVKAVEEACLQLNTRLVDAENRKTGSEQSSIFKPVAAGTREAKPGALLSDANPSDKLTRSSFGRLVGMTISEVLTMLGKPDKVNEDANSQSWIYNAVRLITEDGGLEQSPALIVFEQGCVSRAVLTEKVQYSSEPKESASSNAVVQTDQ